ncbi:MAG: hypothetical protein E3K36_09355 [Candidatus Brocadia sp.]|nr:hypothetical protein [Candidatus Brocadia sp.]
MNLSPENRLLSYCAQIRIPQDAVDKVKDIISLSLDWEEVLNAAFWYGIAPLLYSNLKNIQESQFIPENVMDKLQMAYYSNAARNMRIYAELDRILGAFRVKGMKIIVLKGAALAKTVYGDIGLRPMSDIDLLVKKEDLSHAEKIMTELGYHFHGDMPPEWYRENDQHISYLHPEKNIPVEIHWHIARKAHPSRIRIIDTDIIERWWEEAETIEFSGRKALMLCPNDLIIHLSIHFLQHRFGGRYFSKRALIQLCDILQTLEHYRDEIDWVRVKRRAEQYGIDDLIYATIFIAKEIIKGSDDFICNALTGFASVSLDKELMWLIRERILTIDDDNTFVPNTVVQSRIAHTFQEKIKILLRGVFPHPEVISRRYSIPLSSKKRYLYYLINPFSLLLKYRNLLWNIPRFKEETILKRWISNKD